MATAGGAAGAAAAGGGGKPAKAKPAWETIQREVDSDDEIENMDGDLFEVDD